MTAVFHTHEIRWFFRGLAPLDVADWFTDRCDPEIQPARSDLYLKGLDESLGIKLREGRLEIKQRQGVGESVRFGECCQGEVQAWTKWGLNLAAPAADNLEGSWLPVTKRRQVRYYEVREKRNFTPVPTGRYPERGGGLELTAVTLPDGSEWWTIGVEVFGPEDCRKKDLLAMAEWLFVGPGVPELPLAVSLSYPAWLVGL